ncbi:hypothetical protein QS257_09190 [Terrilactibacillus sp. S3-3]|nr:hypothetical protein QS257_09190 [Terrilactibacillus sp. S3-3]
MEQQYSLFINLLNDLSDDELIKEDIGLIAIELKENFIDEKKYLEFADLIDQIKESKPKFFRKEFPYLNYTAVEYYLYQDDLAKVQAYLQPYIDYPDTGYDEFIPLFNALRYYKKNDLVWTLAKQLVEPVINSPEWIGGAELELVNLILHHLF